ncbi:hypothetical protein CLV30_12553 [Haloactinopolyspora alba]|uniref:Uncharacterized protein n=1 Tax=Haloactinopolyspora alba TaxID=648780 RepID=A0A2P8DHI7_9ACTN|nr:hypothetical protein CLV30_12553 [Haloactinopolyspora alba]
MEHTPSKKTEAEYHPYAECLEEGCGWRAEMSPAARDAAKHHVRAPGHHAHVVTTKVALWGPR